MPVGESLVLVGGDALNGGAAPPKFPSRRPRLVCTPKQRKPHVQAFYLLSSSKNDQPLSESSSSPS